MKLRSVAIAVGLSIGLLTGPAKAALIFSMPGLTTYTVNPGTYVITAIGAGGGSADNGRIQGGYGAIVSGTFTFTQNETLNLLIGGRGRNVGGSEDSGGGGGGTYVVGPLDTPLLIGAGGGGAGVFFSLGGNGEGPVLVGGNGGLAGFGNSGGGGGLLTDGQGQGGKSYLNGGVGGSGQYPGGVGGGGASGDGFEGGGGGGGYTGGNGGGDSSGGSGGFSFNVGLNQSFSLATALSDGSVTISAVAAVPLPAAAPMFGAGLIALGAVGYAAKRKKAAAA